MESERITVSRLSGRIGVIRSHAPNNFPAWMETNLREMFKELGEMIGSYRAEAGAKRTDVSYDEVAILLAASLDAFERGDEMKGCHLIEAVRHVFEGTREAVEHIIEEATRQQ